MKFYNFVIKIKTWNSGRRVSLDLYSQTILSNELHEEVRAKMSLQRIRYLRNEETAESVVETIYRKVS